MTGRQNRCHLQLMRAKNAEIGAKVVSAADLKDEGIVPKFKVKDKVKLNDNKKGYIHWLKGTVVRVRHGNDERDETWYEIETVPNGYILPYPEHDLVAAVDI